jgi:hypothetical protein
VNQVVHEKPDHGGILLPRRVQEVLVDSIARVVDEDVDVEPKTRDFFEKRRRRPGRREIQGDRTDLNSRRSELPRQLLEPIPASCRDDQVCALSGELPRDVPADPARGARHQRAHAFDVRHVPLLCPVSARFA